MGLAASQARLLTLTSRKADCEYGLAMDSMQKMSLTREMSDLSQEYYSRLKTKQIAYYHNGQYSMMNYNYLMGYGKNYAAILSGDKYALKEDKSMVLTDFKGQVVLSDAYAEAITSVLGDGVKVDANGAGGTFDKSKIPQILAALCPGFEASTFQKLIDDENLSASYDANTVNTLTGEETGETVNVDNSDTLTGKCQALLDFYYPIFVAAASNGWTTEYNQAMSTNDDYVSDALVTGTFQIETIDTHGEYDEGTSLTYYITAGLVEQRNDSDYREEVTAWYEAEKERIAEKETLLDIHMQDLSTELEALKIEIDSVQSFIDDATQSVFDWGA